MCKVLIYRYLHSLFILHHDVYQVVLEQDAGATFVRVQAPPPVTGGIDVVDDVVTHACAL